MLLTGAMICQDGLLDFCYHNKYFLTEAVIIFSPFMFHSLLSLVGSEWKLESVLYSALYPGSTPPVFKEGESDLCLWRGGVHQQY